MDNAERERGAGESANAAEMILASKVGGGNRRTLDALWRRSRLKSRRSKKKKKKKRRVVHGEKKR